MEDYTYDVVSTHKVDGEYRDEVQIKGSSHSTKPTVLNGRKLYQGSTFFEQDTMVVKFYDMFTESWVGGDE